MAGERTAKAGFVYIVLGWLLLPMLGLALLCVFQGLVNIVNGHPTAIISVIYFICLRYIALPAISIIPTLFILRGDECIREAGFRWLSWIVRCIQPSALVALVILPLYPTWQDAHYSLPIYILSIMEYLLHMLLIGSSSYVIILLRHRYGRYRHLGGRVA